MFSSNVEKYSSNPQLFQRRLGRNRLLFGSVVDSSTGIFLFYEIYIYHVSSYPKSRIETTKYARTITDGGKKQDLKWTVSFITRNHSSDRTDWIFVWFSYKTWIICGFGDQSETREIIAKRCHKTITVTTLQHGLIYESSPTLKNQECARVQVLKTCIASFLVLVWIKGNLPKRSWCSVKTFFLRIQVLFRG